MNALGIKQQQTVLQIQLYDLLKLSRLDHTLEIGVWILYSLLGGFLYDI